MELYTVVIVEDYVLLSQALASLVNSFDNFEVLYNCNSGKELLKRLKKSPVRPDIVLMDTHNSECDRIETTEILNSNWPSISVVALSVENKDETVLKMIEAGAKGYILKQVSKTTLEKALLEVMEFGYFHNRSLSRILMNSITNPKKKISLKDIEKKFIQYSCTEMTYKEIADKMCKSPKTIDGYRNRLFEKLNLKNRTGLVIYAIKNNLYKL